MSTADLVHHHNYLSGILFLVNEVGWNDSQVNDDWSLIILINQASQSFNSALPQLYRRINAGRWARALGFNAWVSHSPLELRGMVQQTNTYVMSRVYLLFSGGKAIKMTFKEEKF